VCESHIALASIRVIYGAPKTVSPGWRNKATSVAPRKKNSKESKHDEYRFTVIELVI